MPTAEYDRAGYRRYPSVSVPWIFAILVCGSFWSPVAALIVRHDTSEIGQPVYDING